MEGPVKTVCFIASVVITWNLSEIGESLLAWFDYQINGIEIPSNLEFVSYPLVKLTTYIFSRIFRIRIFEFSTKYLSRSAHRTTNFTNPEFQFPQFKVLQSVSIFSKISYIGVFCCILALI